MNFYFENGDEDSETHTHLIVIPNSMNIWDDIMVPRVIVLSMKLIKTKKYLILHS